MILFKITLFIITIISFYLFFLTKRKADILLFNYIFLFINSLPLYSDKYEYVSLYILNDGFHRDTFIIYIILIVLNSFLYFICKVNNGNAKTNYILVDRLFLIFSFLCSFHFIYILLKYDFNTLFFVHKSMMTNKLSLHYDFFTYNCLTLSILLIIKIFNVFRVINLIFLILIILMLLILGDRTVPSFIVICFFLHYFKTQKPSILLFNLKNIMIILFFSLLISLGSIAKALYSDFRAGAIDGILAGYERRDISSYFKNIEYFNNSFILNSVIISDLNTNGATILKAPLSLTPIPRRMLGDSSSEFGRILQTNLFSDLKFGIGHSFFGEFYSLAKLYSCFIGITIFMCIVFFLNHFFINSIRVSIYIMVLAFSAVTISYIYRNSMASYFGILRFIFYPFICCYFFSLLLQLFPKRMS